MPAPRSTVDDYHHLAEVGILEEDDRVELLDGEIILMSREDYRHSKAVRRLSKAFLSASQDRFAVGVHDPIILSEYSEPEPDLVLLANEVDAYEGLPESRHAYLIVEVSDSALSFDRDSKLKAYARAGIAELWIVNLKENAIEVYREPSEETYSSRRIARGNERVAPSLCSDVKVTVSKIVE